MCVSITCSRDFVVQKAPNSFIGKMLTGRTKRLWYTFRSVMLSMPALQRKAVVLKAQFEGTQLVNARALEFNSYNLITHKHEGVKYGTTMEHPTRNAD